MNGLLHPWPTIRKLWLAWRRGQKSASRERLRESWAAEPAQQLELLAAAGVLAWVR